MKTVKIIFLVLLFYQSDMAVAEEPTWVGGDATPRVTGLKVPPNWQDNAMVIRPRLQVSSLPEHFDWREQAPEKRLTAIQNQGSCGSCWAFSTAATFADLIWLRDHKEPDLGEQYLVSCNKHGYSCGGGWYAFDSFIKPLGGVYEVDFPYTATDQACKSGLTYHESLEKNSAFVESDSGVPSVDKIKAAIYTYGPISVAVAASGSFQSYTSGVFNSCGDTGINHAVNIVGWDDKEQYWIMRNSWGQWGENGYMRIKYGCNEIGYAAAFIAYGSSCTPQPYSNAGAKRTIRKGEKTRIGTEAKPETTYAWSPTTGVETPTAARTVVKPLATTTYELKATTKCGDALHKVTVIVK